MTRIEKYRDLRNAIEEENIKYEKLKEKMKSRNLFTRLKAKHDMKVAARSGRIYEKQRKIL